MSKRRVKVTVDEQHLAAARDAVDAGRAGSVSAWVNDALAAWADQDRRLAGLARLVADYEAEHGEITEDEMTAQARRDAASADTIRGLNHPPPE